MFFNGTVINFEWFSILKIFSLTKSLNGLVIDDFKKSDAPQFKGKSEKERRDMALAAYLSRKNEKWKSFQHLLKTTKNIFN